MTTLVEWQEWKRNPTTIEFFASLQALRESIKEDWVSGMYTAATSDGTVQLNAKALGQVQIIDRIMETSFEDVE